jgi:WD40 repeat protein
MNRWNILPLGLLLSSLLAVVAQRTTSDLSNLELLTSINAPGHAAGTLTNDGDFQTRGSLALSSDGSRLASLDTTGTLKLWDARNGNELRTFTKIPGEIVRFKNYKTVMLKQPVYDPDNTDPLKSARLKLNLDTGQVSADPDFKQCQLKTNATKLVSTCSADSRLFARFRKKQVDSLNIVAVVDVIDLASGQVKYTIQNPEIHVDDGVGLEFNPEGTAIAVQFSSTLGGQERRVGVQVFSLKDGKTRSVFETGLTRVT